MAWCGDFKRKRFEELNHMKLKDRCNYHMTSEYQYILNGIADPTMTTNFSDDYKLKTDHHRRKYAKRNHFMQTKMANLKPKNMVSRTGVVKDHEAPNNFPSYTGDRGADRWVVHSKQGEVSNGSTDNKQQQSQAISVKINVNNKSGSFSGNGYFAERFRQLLASQLSFDFTQ